MKHVERKLKTLYIYIYIFSIKFQNVSNESSLLFEEKNIDSTLVISSFRKYQRKRNHLLTIKIRG